MQLIVFFLILISVNITAQWVNLNPIQPFEDLNKIDFIDQNIGWIAGKQGIVLFTNDGGANWVNRNTPSANLKYIDFVNANTGYVSSESNMMYKTTNSGINWFQLNMNNYSPIYSFYFTDANNGIICAGNNLIKTTNGGANWNIILTGNDRYFLYNSFINSNTGYVTSFNGEILKTTNFGINWTANNAPYGKIFFTNENTGWLYIGTYNTNSLNKTTDGGLSWTNQPNPLHSLLSVGFIDNNTGFAVGSGSSNLIKTTNGGENWIQYQFNSSSMFEDIKIINFNTAIISGSRNFIAKSTNTGLNWNNISKKFGTNIGVKFFDVNTGYISGECGIFARSSDGGNTWIKNQLGTLANFSFYFLNLNTGWLLSSEKKVYKTTNAGSTWDISVLNTSKLLFNINFADHNTGWISGDSGTIIYTTNGGSDWLPSFTGINSRVFKTVRFNNQNLAAITLDTMILVSTNFGNSWIINNFPLGNSFTDICITDNNSALAFGYNTLLRTTNSGMNWLTVDNDLPGGGKYVNYISNTFYALTGSNVYKSINGGVNWSGSIIGSDPFVCFTISFINENTGWVAGENGSLFRNTNSTAIGIEPISNEIPNQFLLFQNYPNPFNPETSIKFNLPENSFVKLIVYDITGREVDVLLNESMNKGIYETKWNASYLPSGVYFYRLISEKFSEFRKMILIK